MRTGLQAALLSALAISFPSSLSAQGIDGLTNAQQTVLALPLVLMKYPEQADDYISKFSDLYDRDFFNCLQDRIDYWKQQAGSHELWCADNATSDAAYRQCTAQNLPAKNAMLMLDIGAAARGDINISESATVAAAAASKAMLGELHVEAMEASYRQTGPFMVCAVE